MVIFTETYASPVSTLPRSIFEKKKSGWKAMISHQNRVCLNFEITPRRVFPVGNLPCLSLGDPCANAGIWLLATQLLKPSYEWDHVIIRLNPADTPQLTATWKGPRRVSCFWVQSSFQVSLVFMRCPLLLVSVITLLNIWLYYQGKMIWHTFVYTTVKIWYIFYNWRIEKCPCNSLPNKLQMLFEILPATILGQFGHQSLIKTNQNCLI